MAESSTSASAAQAQVPGRTSGRNKVKSQRAQDSEDTARMFAAAKAKQKADAEAIARGEVPPSSMITQEAKGKSRTSGEKGKGKASKEEVFCLCRKPSEIEDGPMIECAECNDWFHFKCINLSDEQAEKIHDYICQDCHEATGKNTTMVHDVNTYKSPSPLAGEVPVTKRKQIKTRASGNKAGPSSSTNSDDGEGSSTSSESGSDAEDELLQRKPIKRHRSSRDNSRKPSIDVKPARPTQTSRKSNVVLPKARIFVLDKLAELVRGIFGNKMDEEGISRYAKNVEDSLFEAFKDGIGSKAVAGGRYKTQFTLLDRSLPKARPELLEEITSFKIDASKVALLNSADLATAERLEELERAKRTMLEQTVKQKDNQGAIRLGRDGFEQVEDFRERDMGLLARQEQAARKEAARRESWNLNEEGGSPVVPDSPFGRRDSASATPQMDRVQANTQSQPQSPVVKRESVDIRPTPTPVPASVPVTKSPIKSNFGLTSAWGGADDSEAQSLSLSLGDQSALDLSDIVQEPEVDIAMEVEEIPVKREILEDKPVVWSGGIMNPAVETSRPVKMEARVAAKTSFIPQWNILLPHDPVAITGRVPVKASLAYLSESRLNPSRELLTVVFSPSAGSEEDTKAWNELIDFHIAKDRHAIYHPHGARPDRPVPNYAAKELYLIPLRPTDKLPEFTDLLDDFSVPTTRTTSIFLGIFIGDKKTLYLPPPGLAPKPTPTPPAPAVSLPNAKLQELMKSLNPAALAGVLGGSKSPILPPPHQQQQQQAYQPYEQGGYGQQQYPPPGQSYYPPANNGYNQYNNQYAGHSPYDHHQQYNQGHGSGGATPDWQSMPPPQNRDNRDRDRQQGWERRY